MVTKDSFRDQLEQSEGNELAESWKPEPGDLLVGKILRYEERSTDYGDRYIVIIEDEDTETEIAVWLLHSVLQNEFQRKLPKPGERVGLKRLTDDPKKGYKRYVVKVDGRKVEETMPDFSKFTKAADQEAEKPEITDKDIPF